MTKWAWPRVLLGGAPKCGTTALHAALEASGAFDVLWRKELFALNDPGFSMRPPAGGFASLGPSCYTALGIESGAVFLDGSSTYLYQDIAVQALAQAHDEGVPFLTVFVLRDPVERIVSNYRYFRFILGQDVGAHSLDEYTERLLAGDLHTGIDQVDDALAHSRYASYLGNWRARLPAERLLVLDSDAVRTDMAAVVRTILARVGLVGAESPRASLSSRGNQSYVPPWPWAHRGALWLGSLVPHGALRRMGTAAYHRVMGSLAREDGDTLGHEARNALTQVLAPDVQGLVSLYPEASSWGWVTSFGPPLSDLGREV